MSAKNLVRKVLDLGTAAAKGPVTVKKIQLTNQIFLLIFGISVAFAFIHLVSLGTVLLVYDLSFIVGWILVPLLNHRGHINASRLLLPTYFTVLLVFYACLLGEAAGAQAGLFAVVGLGLALFEPRDRLAIAYTAVLPVAAYSLLDLTDFRLLPMEQELVPALPSLVGPLAIFF